jgi:hypothetical protein
LKQDKTYEVGEMTSELEEMALNIAAGERICALEQQYLADHPKDFVGLAHMKYQLLAGHCHEIEDVLARNHYFCDDVVMYFAVSQGMGAIARGLSKR